MDSTTAASLLGIGFAAIMIFSLIGLAVLIISIIGMWKVFTKAGEEGWKSIIPFYNSWTLAEISGKPGWWGLLIYLPGVLSYFAFSDSNFGGIILSLAGIAAFVFSILIFFNLSKSFGHGGGFTVGLVLLTTIFLCILGFGSSKYVGPGGIPTTPAVPSSPPAPPVA